MSGEPLRGEVAKCHAENPAWSGSRIAREIHRSKADVLAALRELRDEGHVASGSALEAVESQFLSRPMDAFGVKGARWDATSLALPPDLSFSDYCHIGWALGRTRDMTAWAFGEWIDFGEVRYGEKYAQAIELTGRLKQTLMNYASVARRVPRHVRRADLSWSHHAEVASLAPDAGEQERWLAAAAANSWSVEELRGMREPVLPIAVDSVPDLGADEQALVLHEYRKLKGEHGDRVTPTRMRRSLERRLSEEDRRLEAERARAACLEGLGGLGETFRLSDGIELRTGDFRVALSDVEARSVSLVFTDPPYFGGEFLPLWDGLSEASERLLQPGRMLISYSGNLIADEAIARLGEHLEFVSAGAVELPGPQSRLQNIQMNVGCKPLLFFSAGRYEPRAWFTNLVRHDRPEKWLHPWQQALGCAEYYISTFTEPGELVVDPFVGSGTTAVAARNLGRRFAGCDINPERVAEAVKRLGTDDQPDSAVRNGGSS